jgi:hypothetical protein
LHLLLATPEPNLSSGMQYVNGRYAQWANWHRDERSHVFDGRFRSILVNSESHALEVHRYIALNPVRAGLVRDPEEWPWSSLRAILGREQPRGFLDVDTVLGEFGSNRATARRRLRRFIRDGLRMDIPDQALESMRLKGSGTCLKLSRDRPVGVEGRSHGYGERAAQAAYGEV